MMAKSGKFRHAVQVLVMFHCMLRIGEAVNLRQRDIALPHQGRFGASSPSIISCIRIAKAKTGTNQSVSITDTHVQALLQYLLATHPVGDNDPLFQSTSDQFTSSFRSACTALGIGDCGFVPHSCRHGGATLAHVNGMSIEQIMLRGRWKSNDSCRRYIQTRQAVLLTVDLPQSVHDLGRDMASDLASNLIRVHNAWLLARAN